MDDAGVNHPLSVREASGVWFATPLFIIFVLCQSRGLQFDARFLIALPFWALVGIGIDLWARRWKPTEPADERKRRNDRTMIWMVVASAVLIAVWTLFRPDAAALSSATWVAPVNRWLERLSLILPGLDHARHLLIAAGRGDVAAYFGSFQVFAVVVWVASVPIWCRLASVSPAQAAQSAGGKRLAERARAHLGWRILYWSMIVFTIVLVIGSLSVFWHQEVTGLDRLQARTWHNAIAGSGAFVFPMLIMAAGACGFAWMAHALHANLRAPALRT